MYLLGVKINCHWSGRIEIYWRFDSGHYLGLSLSVHDLGPVLSAKYLSV